MKLKYTYMTGNCLRLEGTGNLNHYNCEDRFIRGCPNTPYTDEEIYKCRLLLSIFYCKVFFLKGLYIINTKGLSLVIYDMKVETLLQNA